MLAREDRDARSAVDRPSRRGTAALHLNHGAVDPERRLDQRCRRGELRRHLRRRPRASRGTEQLHLHLAAAIRGPGAVDEMRSNRLGAVDHHRPAAALVDDHRALAEDRARAFRLGAAAREHEDEKQQQGERAPHGACSTNPPGAEPVASGARRRSQPRARESPEPALPRERRSCRRARRRRGSQAAASRETRPTRAPSPALGGSRGRRVAVGSSPRCSRRDSRTRRSRGKRSPTAATASTRRARCRRSGERAHRHPPLRAPTRPATRNAAQTAPRPKTPTIAPDQVSE